METRKDRIDHVGETVIRYLDGVVEIRIYDHPSLDNLRMEICLGDDSWEAREVVIDQMVDVQAVFFEDFVIEYSFGAADPDAAVSCHSEQRALVYS